MDTKNNFIGQNVLYLPNGKDNEAPQAAPLPATVTSINADGTLNLSVLLENTGMPVIWRKSIPHTADAAGAPAWDYRNNDLSQNAFLNPQNPITMDIKTKLSEGDKAHFLENNAIAKGSVSKIDTDTATAGVTTVTNTVTLADSTTRTLDDSKAFATPEDLCADLLAQFKAAEAAATAAAPAAAAQA